MQCLQSMAHISTFKFVFAICFPDEVPLESRDLLSLRAFSSYNCQLSIGTHSRMQRSLSMFWLQMRVQLVASLTAGPGVDHCRQTCSSPFPPSLCVVIIRCTLSSNAAHTHHSPTHVVVYLSAGKPAVPVTSASASNAITYCMVP